MKEEYGQKEKSTEWWNRIVVEFSDEEWWENFRMSRTLFNYLCSKLREQIERQDTRLRCAIPVDRRVAITLWRLATNADYRSTGHIFGVAKGTVCVIVHEVCDAIVRVLMKKYIKFPSGNQLTEVLNGFERCHGFSQFVGAVDGTHIEILAPEDCTKDYYNRIGYHSIILQVFADHRYCFTDINIGWPGSVHDACVIKNSQLYKRYNQGSLVPATCYRLINDVKVPPIILKVVNKTIFR